MVRRGPVAFAIGGEMEEIGIDDVEEIDTIIAELEISKGKGNLILCVVNAPVYRDQIIRVLEDRFTSKVIVVELGEDIIQTLKGGDFGEVEILIWSMPEKLTEGLADTLNNFRELFYDARIPNLVFLSQSVLDDVIRRAPDFWRYRGNYYELKGTERGRTFEALDTLATPLHYQNKEDLLRRKRINEYLLENVRDLKETVTILDELGKISYNLGEYGSASEYFKKELKAAQELGDKSSVSKSLHNLGALAQATGDIEEARRLYGESLKIFQELGDKSGVAITLAQSALLEEMEGNLERALDLIRRAETIFLELKSPMAAQTRKDRERLEQKVQDK